MPRITLLAALVLLLFGSTAAHALEARRVTGHARGADAAARDRAVEMAVREAVLGAIQERVPSQRLTPYEPILERAGDFVLDLRIVDYDARDGISTIEAAVRLREDALRTAIADAWLDEALFKPRVAALTAARNEGEPFVVIPGNSAQTALESALTDRGLEVTGLDVLTRYDDLPALAAMADDAEAAAARLARAHLCDAAVFLLSTVSAEPVPGSTNVYAVTAVTTMIVASPREGAPVQLERSEALMHGADPDQAAEAAIASAAARLVRVALPAVILAAAAAEPRGDDIIVTVEGTLDDDAFSLLEARFAAIRGVEGVERLFHAQRGARLRVKFPADPAGFIEPAMRDLPPTLPLAFVRIIDREMHLRWGPANP